MKAYLFLFSWSLFFFIQKGSAQSVNKTVQEANEQSKAVLSWPETRKKADTLIMLSQWYYDHLASDTTFTDKAYTLAVNAQRLATKLKYNRGLFNACLLLSNADRAKGDFRQGISDAESALRYANTLKDENAIGDAWTALWGSNTGNGMSYKDQVEILLKAESAFINSGDKKRQADCDFRLADIYLYLRDFTNTRTKLNLALKLYQQIRYTHLAPVYDLLGMLELQLGNYVPAVKYGLLAVKTAEEQEDTAHKRGLYYFGLGSTYKAIPNYPLAEKYFRKALIEETKYKNLDGIFQISIYLNWVLCVQRKEREGLKVLTDMTRNYPSIEKRDMIQYAGAMLDTYEGLKEYKNAMPYGKILEAAKKTSAEDFGAMDVIYNRLIPFYAVLGNRSKVKQYSKEYYQHLKTVNVPKGWYEYYLMNAYTDSIAGDYFGALKNHRIAIKFRDSMTNQNTMQQISELNVMYETAQKDRDLSALKKESGLKSILISQSNRVRNISVLLATTLMAIAVIIFIGYKRKQRTNLLLKRHQDEIDRKNEALQTLVKEKEWLVKEIHHRVKNNLHMVVGLLASQTEFLKNKEALDAISDSQNRIQAMSLIHQKLYQMSDMSSINMPVYIQELTDHLKDAFKESTHVLFKLHITDVKFPLTYSVPIGLILNEAITNAMKYAFPDKKGIIEIRLDVLDNNYHLSIKDNGIGLPKGFDVNECNSLGIILMNGLSGDIGGTLHMKNQETGLLIEVIFPVENTALNA